MWILLNYEFLLHNFAKNTASGRIFLCLLFRYMSKSKKKHLMFKLKYLFSDIPSDLICLSFVQARKCICLSDGFDYSKSKLDPSNCNYMCSDTTLLSTDCGGETGFNVFLTGDILKWLHY